MKLSVVLLFMNNLIAIAVCKIGNNLGADDYIRATGYPYEKHIIITEDNYVLQLDRLPFGLKNNTNTNRPPILLVHGLAGSSSNFLLLGPNKALGFQLVDIGYDVWLANCRGSFSTNHTILHARSSEFWNFSWHEIGVYDIPAIIDHILKITKYEQLVYIGHSQGCAAAIVMLSEKPEYNFKIKALILYSPAVFLCHSKNVIMTSVGVLEADGRLNKLRNRIGDFNFGFRSPIFLQICDQHVPTYILCVAFLHLITDLTPSSIPHYNFILLLLKYEHAGISIKQLVHFAQSYNTCQFRYYKDFVDVMPKEYNISNVKVPVYAMSGSTDAIIPTEDVVLLGSKLLNGFKEYYDIPGFAHSDFIFGKYAPEMIYVKTIDIINKLYN